MNIVNAKCPACGKVISVDCRKDASICKECGEPFITAKGIEEYNKSINTENNIDPHMKTLFDLGVQAFYGKNYNEAYSYFLSASQFNSRQAQIILYKGLTAGYLSKLDQRACYLRLAETRAAIDIVFKNNNLFSQLDKQTINQFVYQTILLVNVVCNSAQNLYVPGYREMDNIKMVWTTLEEGYDTLTLLGSYFRAIFPGECTAEQKELIKTTYSLSSSILARLMDERIYSVDWGWRSGLGQRNKIRHPNYKELLSIKNTLDADAKRYFPDFIPKS